MKYRLCIFLLAVLVLVVSGFTFTGATRQAFEDILPIPWKPAR